LSNPWVKEIAVARKLPGTVWIYVNEYVPFAILSNEGFFYMNYEGVVFKKMERMDDKNFPVLTGVSDGKNLQEALGLLKTYLEMPIAEFFPPAEISLSRARGFIIMLDRDNIALRLGFENLEEKIERFYSILKAIGMRGRKIRYVDLNIPGKVVIKYES